MAARGLPLFRGRHSWRATCQGKQRFQSAAFFLPPPLLLLLLQGSEDHAQLHQLRQRLEILICLSRSARLVQPPQGGADAPAPPPAVVVAQPGDVAARRLIDGR